MTLEVKEKVIIDLEEKANKVRQSIINMLVEAKSGHSAGPLGMADIFTALYFNILKHDPKNPSWDERDRLILSNGHICPVQYAAMALAGYFPLDELQTLRKINSRLQGHPHRTVLPGIENTSGPLGEGISQAIGMALAANLDKKNYRIYCLTSDGEHQEGNIWEAIMFAGKLHLHNLIVVVDRNNIQIDGTTEDIMPLEPFKEKYEAFNWHVLEIDGNNIRSFINTIEYAKSITEKPVVIIANTIPGKGVSFMEGNYLWHGNPPDAIDVPGAPPKGEQAQKALDELKIARDRIMAEK